MLYHKMESWNDGKMGVLYKDIIIPSFQYSKWETKEKGEYF